MTVFFIYFRFSFFCEYVFQFNL